MKTITIATGIILIFGVALLVPLNYASAQSWQNIGVDFSNSSDRGKITARYRTEKVSSAKNGCRTTVELKNESGKAIMSFKVKISFKEGDNHERRGSYLGSGDTVQWTYETCGINSVQILEVK